MPGPEELEILIREVADAMDSQIKKLQNTLPDEAKRKLSPDQEALFWLGTGKLAALNQSRAHITILLDYFKD